MDIKERMKKFNKRWSIVSVKSYEESFQKFKVRILNILKDIDAHVTKESIALFCQYYGIEEKWHRQIYGDRSWSTNIGDRLFEENNEKEFYRLVEVILSLDITSEMGYRHEYIYSKNIILGKIIEAIELSDINVSIAVAKEEIILYPRGEKNLDEELVELPLSFLDEKSAEHFIQGLQFYQSKKFIKSAESLRRSLEEFLRSKLNNKKGLKVNIIELQKLLKIKNLDSQIRNTILQVFTFMDQYFNENSKHNDGNINEQENEFLVYQIGLLMRYINYNI